MSRLNYLPKSAPIIRTIFDRVLEYLSLTIALFICGLSVLFYLQAPEQIPTHFNAMGQPNDWGGRGMYFMLGGIALASMGLMNYSAYNYRLFNLPFRLNPDRLGIQLFLLGRMARFSAILIGLLFISILGMSATPQLKLSANYFYPLFLSFLILLFGTMFFFLIRIWSVGRK